jgi:hypothetical protein
MQKKYLRTVAIDQLRVHAMRFINFYMQAIWAHQPPDQRFFRLYNKQVFCPCPEQTCGLKVTGTIMKPTASDSAPVNRTVKAANRYLVSTNFWSCKPVVDTTQVDLLQLADIDNPLDSSPKDV